MNEEEGEEEMEEDIEGSETNHRRGDNIKAGTDAEVALMRKQSIQALKKQMSIQSIRGGI